VAAVIAAGCAVGPRAYGRYSLVPEGEPLDPQAVFDLASLTKVVATLPCVLRLVQEGSVRLDDHIGMYLGGLHGSPAGDATVRQLLTHTSGLPAHHHFWREQSDGASILACIRRFQLDHREQVVYSDIGFILLGYLVEAVRGAGLDQVGRAEVFAPLGMQATAYGPRREAVVVPTELGTERGVVHDENARAMGGVAGHAGLFAPAADLVPYCRLWLQGGSPLLDPGLVRLAVSDCSHGQGRGLGWLLPGAGSVFPSAGVAHTGFTGTSLWLEPRLGVAAVLLTNAVHPARGNPATPRLRTEFHRAVYAAVLLDR
jgi:CubicO group peptidase (beta-lactamase class C family)